MSRRKSRPQAAASQVDVDHALDGMQRELSAALHRLLADTKADPSAAFATHAVAGLVDAWAVAALEMIDAAARCAVVASSSTSKSRSVATVTPEARVPADSADPDSMRSALLESLKLIVEATRAGRPDVDEACAQFADTFAGCLRDAIASAYLRTATAFENELGISQGLMN